MRKHDHACSECPLLQVFTNALVECGGMVRVRSQDPPRGSDRVRSTGWSQFSKNSSFVGRLGSGPRLVSRIGSGPRLVGRVRSEVRVSDSFHISSCAVVRAAARSCSQVLGTPIIRRPCSDSRRRHVTAPIDADMSMRTHVTAVVRACFAALRQCRVLSLSDCRYSLNPLSQTRID